MKIINLGGREIKIMGSPITPFYYKQEFKQSLSGDLMAMKDLNKDISKFDDINLLQMVWAMEKTTNKDIKPFKDWLNDFEYLDLGDIIEVVAEEATNATFRDKPKTTK